MDVNETLRRMREIVSTGHEDCTETCGERYSGELFDLFEVLDAWLSQGGFLPEGWKR